MDGSATRAGNNNNNNNNTSWDEVTLSIEEIRSEA